MDEGNVLITDDHLDFLSKQTNLFSRQLCNKKDEIIKERFIAHGIDVTDIEFIKTNITIIQRVGDKFEHYFLYYGTPDEKRLMSMAIHPDVESGYDNNKNSYRMTASYKYW